MKSKNAPQWRWAVVFACYALSGTGAAGPWTTTEREGDIAYFAVLSPNRIERFDLANESWLEPIPLSNSPLDMDVSDGNLYVSTFGQTVVEIPLAGGAHRNISTPELYFGDFWVFNGAIIGQGVNSALVALDVANGEVLDTFDGGNFQRRRAIQLNETSGVLMYVSGTGATAIRERLYAEANGQLNHPGTNRYHGILPIPSQTYAVPSSPRFLDNTGLVFDSEPHDYVTSLGGSFDDADFTAEGLPIVRRGSVLHAYSENYLETGVLVLQSPPRKIIVHGGKVHLFMQILEGREIAHSTVSLAAFGPSPTGQPFEPADIDFAPTSIACGPDGTVYLLVSDEQSIVRWSSAEQRYLASIPLTGAPEIMTYSEHHNALFLGYAGGKITELNLDDTLQEENFANAVGSFLALEPAGEFIFACTPTQGTYTEYWAAKRETFPTRYFTFDYGEYTDTFRWSPAHRRMYHLRDLTTPNDLFGLPIDVNGQMALESDSPYHGDYAMEKPVLPNPDGSVVLLGSGNIFDAVTLEYVDQLPNTILDAVWLNGTLYSVRSEGKGLNGNFLQRWQDAEFTTAAEVPVEGETLRLFGVDNYLVVVGMSDNRPLLKVYDAALNLIDPPNPADLNDDGIVDAVDVQTVINIVLGVAEGSGDANRDSLVDASDIQTVINAALGR